MDWAQVLTIISTTVTTFAAGGYALHSFLRGDIKEFKQEIKEDMRAMEDRFERRMEMYEADKRYTDERIIQLDEKWNERMNKMDEKWERLFERLLIQDKERART